MLPAVRTLAVAERYRRWVFRAIVVAASVAATGQILSRSGGEPALPLDDAFIHFQYARTFAELSPLVYTNGQPAAPGATSLLWPLVLAPFWAAGLKGQSLIFAAWLLGWLSFGLLVQEAYAATHGLLSPAGRFAAALMCVAFGAFTWSAGSGMEIMPFAWLLLRTARRSSEWVESAPGVGPRLSELWLLAIAATLMRPEGFVACLWIGLALFVYPKQRRLLSRLSAGAVSCLPLLPPLLYWLLSGRAESTTSSVKWLLSNPYYSTADVLQKIGQNSALFFTSLLNGGAYTGLFVPRGSAFVAGLALPALLFVGKAHGRSFRACSLVWLGAAIFIPTSYDSYLVNRLRYLWPFAAPWLLGSIALVELAVGSVSRVRAGWQRSLNSVKLASFGILIGALAGKLPGSIDDLAASADAIDRQQVSLARWASRALPEASRIGLNDAGALAYFSGRSTFDIVGLTTASEGEHWVAGPGSRFEHYERLSPSELPTHFIVYPEWFGLYPLLGRFLTERHVPHRTILGGPTMGAYVADYSSLGSASTPASPKSASILDRLDIADLKSEAQHAYLLGRASQRQNFVAVDGNRVDGGRSRRRSDEFHLELAAGGRLVARFGSDCAQRLDVFIDEERVAQIVLARKPWQEHVVTLPASIEKGRHHLRVEARADHTFSSFHYWSVAAPTRPEAPSPETL